MQDLIASLKRIEKTGNLRVEMGTNNGHFDTSNGGRTASGNGQTKENTLAIREKQLGFGVVEKLKSVTGKAKDPNYSLTTNEKLVADANVVITNIMENKENILNANIDKRSLPPELEDFKRLWSDAEKTRSSLPSMPIFSQLSPHSQRKLSTLPPPNDDELQQIDRYEASVKKVSTTVLYDRLKKVSNIHVEASGYDKTNKNGGVKLTGNHTHVDYVSTQYYKKINDSLRRRADRDAQIQGIQSIYSENIKNKDKIPVKKEVSAAVSMDGKGNNLLTYLESHSKQAFLSPIKRTMSGRASVDNDKSSNNLLHPSLRMISKIDPKVNDLRVMTAPESPSPSKHGRVARNKLQGLHVRPLSGLLLHPITRASTASDKSYNIPVTTGPHPFFVQNEDSILPIPLDHYVPVLHEVIDTQELIKQNYIKEQTRYQLFLKHTIAQHRRDEATLVTHSLTHSLSHSLTHSLTQDEMKTQMYDEFDINLDPVYTKRRLYGKGTLMLVYYVNLFKLTNAMSHLKYQVSQINKFRVEWAGNYLRRVGRGMLGRLFAREKRRQLALQLEAAEERERLRILLLNTKASIITRNIFRYSQRKKIWKRLQLKDSCITIQRVIRGKLGRNKYKIMQRIARARYNAGTTIQCMYRQRLARRRLVVTRKINIVMSYLAKISASEEAIKLKYRNIGAAGVIVRYIRSYMVRKKLHNLLHWRHHELALKIQSIYRRYIIRKNYVRTIRKIRFKDRSVGKAAAAIQKVVRSRLDRDVIYQLKKAKLLQRRERIEGKQRYFRWGSLFPPRIYRYLFRALFGPFRYNFEWYHAITIQRVWRGYRYGRKRRYIKSLQLSYSKFYRRVEAKRRGVLRLQALYRGYRYRCDRDRKLRVKKSVIIQCFWRRTYAMKQLRSMKAQLDAGRLLGRNLKILIRWRKSVKLKDAALRLNRYVKRVQLAVRRWLGAKRLNRRKHHARYRYEVDHSVNDNINRLYGQVQFRILLESAERAIGSYTSISIDNHEYSKGHVSDNPCVCLGPGQAIFVYAVGQRARGGFDSKVPVTCDYL